LGVPSVDLLKLGDYHFKTHQYLLAYDKYLEFYELSEYSTPHREYAAYRIGTTLFAAARDGDALDRFTEFLSEYPNSQYRPAAEMAIGIILFANGKYSELSAYLADLHEAYSGKPAGKEDDPLWREGIKLISLCGYLSFASDFSNPLLIEQLIQDLSAGLLAEPTARIIETYNKTKVRKSPGLAGFFSAILPGGGQMYSGKVFDGLSAFLITGGLAGFAAASWHDRIAYDSRERSLIIPIFVTSGAAFFYIVNIWNAVSTAQRRNIENHDRLESYMKETLFGLFFHLDRRNFGFFR
jgi:hypothetical protein